MQSRRELVINQKQCEVSGLDWGGADPARGLKRGIKRAVPPEPPTLPALQHRIKTANYLKQPDAAQILAVQGLRCHVAATQTPPRFTCGSNKYVAVTVMWLCDVITTDRKGSLFILTLLLQNLYSYRGTSTHAPGSKCYASLIHLSVCTRLPTRSS